MITATGLELRAGSRLLLSGATFRIAPGDRVGLVGRNGAGKTTLTRVLAGEGAPAAGEVTRSGHVGYLPQDPRTGDPEVIAKDRILSARGLDDVVTLLRSQPPPEVAPGQYTAVVRVGNQEVTGTIQVLADPRASLEELLTDYRDFLRTRGLEEWPAEHAYTLRLRKLNQVPDATYETFRKGIENPDPAISANVIIGLIRVTTYLLSRQLHHLESAFIEEGGLRERMTRARLQERQKNGSGKG